ncbi:MAG: hypothetical protein JO257_31990 [Deltaproteobacteria bacterium]|nr:hypothetical protein [Deltaproteobacteria bacterium]
MTWRDGVHLTGTPIWCDARRRRDVCFVSSADRIGPGHGQLIATPLTLSLIGAKDQLGVPLRRPFTLGTLRLELIPSGRGVGAAALHVEAGERSVLYAGAIRTTAQPALEGADVRAADAVVVASPLAEEVELPALPQAAEQLAAWVREHAASVIVVDTIVDGIEIIGWLRSLGIEVAATRALREAKLAAGLAEPAPKGPVFVKVEGDRTKPPPGAAIQRVTARSWPFVSSDRELLAWIEQTRAKQVFVTGAGAQRIVDAIGARAKRLGPPTQMSLAL